MIILALIALVAIIYRIKTRVFTRAEGVLLAIIAANFLLIWAQIVIKDHAAFPEKRYWVQSFTLLLGWTAWGIGAVCKSSLARRFKPIRFVFPLIVALFALNDLIMVIKPKIPVGRRHAWVAACNWATDRIRADWKGPAQDETDVFSTRQYHQPKRPCVAGHTARIAYLLNGRVASINEFGKIDRPDYICKEEAKIGKLGDDYELMDHIQFGKRRFALYRSRGREGGAK